MDFSSFMPPADIAAYEKGAFGKRMGFGNRPAVLVVDMTYGFIDAKFKLATGESGWGAVEGVRRLLDQSRKVNIPIVYTKIAIGSHESPAEGSISRKISVDEELSRPKAGEIVAQITPSKGDIVIEKRKASAFFGTHLQ